MINFKIESIEVRYLYVRVTLKTIKEEDNGQINRKIKFYFVLDENLVPLDTTIFYTKYLPNDITYEDLLLVNGQQIRFKIDTPLLREGFETKIVAIDENSISIQYMSEPIYLKTKEITSLQFNIKNKFDGSFVSNIHLDMSEIEEDSIIKEYRIEQRIETYGINNSLLSLKEDFLLNGRDFYITHDDINEYGSYKITTSILNNKNVAIISDVSYYSKQIEPLAIVCKMNLPDQDNFLARRPIRVAIKKETPYAPRVVKMKINMWLDLYI